MLEHRSLVFLVAALLCFLVALLLATDILSGGNYAAWVSGGLASFVAAHF